MSWYVAAAWGALGGFIMELISLGGWAVRVAILKEQAPDVPNRGAYLALVVFVGLYRVFLGALSGTLINLNFNPSSAYPVVLAGFTLPLITGYLGMFARILLTDTKRAKRVVSAAERLDVVRKESTEDAGASSDLGEILEDRRAALISELRTVGPQGEGGCVN
jgi:hypothetical protein